MRPNAATARTIQPIRACQPASAAPGAVPPRPVFTAPTGVEAEPEASVSSIRRIPLERPSSTTIVCVLLAASWTDRLASPPLPDTLTVPLPGSTGEYARTSGQGNPLERLGPARG